MSTFNGDNVRLSNPITEEEQTIRAELFADVSLVGYTPSTPAILGHRLVLGARCPLLKSCLLNPELRYLNADQRIVVILPDFSSNDIRSAVEWIYAPLENVFTLSNGAKDLLELLGQNHCEIINKNNIMEEDCDVSESDAAEEESIENAFDESFNLDEADLLNNDEQKECDDKISGLENIDLQTTDDPLAVGDSSKRMVCAVLSCDFVAATLLTLKNHTIARHRLLKCAFCDKKRPLKSLANHVAESHSGVTKSFEIAEVRSLAGPAKEEVQQKRRRFTCEEDGCYFSTMLKRNLNAHIAEEHDEKIICSKCGQDVSRSKMKRHMRQLHKEHEEPTPKKLEYQCEICAKFFCSSYSLRQHRKLLHDLGDDLHACSHCKGRVFTNETTRDEHANLCKIKVDIKPIRWKKTQSNPNSEYSKFVIPGLNPLFPLRCPRDNCDYEATHESVLKGHWVGTHEKRKCPYCNKEVVYAYLDRHIKVSHTREFDHACKEPGCAEKFYTESLLENHREEVHVAELSYTCSVCGKQFYSSFRMKKHFSSKHREGLTGDKYACPVEGCDPIVHNYTGGTGLKKHMKKHHYEAYLEREKIKPSSKNTAPYKTRSHPTATLLQ